MSTEPTQTPEPDEQPVQTTPVPDPPATARPTRRYPAPIGWVIAAVILFWPTAIPALLASHRAARATGAGDVATADRESATAKRWSVASVWVAATLVVLSVVASILVATLAVTTHHGGHHGRWHQGGGYSNQQPFGVPTDGPGRHAGRQHGSDS